ncbi:hypothetical protein F4780DRAFT_782815 [Xylariomycetidae sp. FL0641]|nr:hypothetical protein F4780DRAFT_782815 [Xylariomycetidae sp. FL0641]
MSRMSRGCLRCRQRRVKCDQGRPSCQRCIKRDELCQGYRDDASLIFRDETDKTTRTVEAASSGHAYPSRHHRRSRSSSDSHASTNNVGLAPEDAAVEAFMQNYVVQPCNQKSSPGFLEHLPCMYKEVNVNGRYALRWAVQAAACADGSRDARGGASQCEALHYYGRSLSAFAKSLSTPGKVPDDYDLMTVVMLDIFENVFFESPSMRGSHAQGMAQILRLRGHEQFHNPRGWSLFQLAHHKLLKQQLAFKLKAPEEFKSWITTLDDDTPSVRLDKDVINITHLCERARELEASLSNNDLSAWKLLEVIDELYELDRTVVSWRENSRWSYNIVKYHELTATKSSLHPLTERIELHPDWWMAYEWNYHRTARLLAHEQMLKCVSTASKCSELEASEAQRLPGLSQYSTLTIRNLADQVLSTVPQILGDIDHTGRLHDHSQGPPRNRAIGGYLLLWPIKTIKASTTATTPEQKKKAETVFGRIREYTGMKTHLGDMSAI